MKSTTSPLANATAVTAAATCTPLPATAVPQPPRARRFPGRLLAFAVLCALGLQRLVVAGEAALPLVDLYDRSTGCHGARCDQNNAVGKRSDPLDAVKIDLVSQMCSGGRPCTDAQLEEVMQVQNELAQSVNQNAMATIAVVVGAIAAGTAAAVGATLRRRRCQHIKLHKRDIDVTRQRSQGQ
jgi:hypothetical protein